MTKSRMLFHSAMLIAAMWLIPLCVMPLAADTSFSYRLGPEDVVVLTVLGHTEFSGEFLIPADGSLTLPSVGAVSASGMTLDELAAEATKRLKERLVDPEVTVTLRTPRMQRLYVLGAVKAPGQYDVKTGWRIAEAIAAAGGLAPETEPADCEVIIQRSRESGRRETRNLGDVLRGNADANLAVESGDVLTIDSGETFPVYVMGRVRDPGLYRVRKAEAGVMEALTLAGGTMDDAVVSAVRVTRLSGVSETVDVSTPAANDRQGANVRLQPGDMVLVPETTARVAVLGYVAQPGFYTLKDGQKMILSDALGLARGVDNKRGQMRSIAIIRTENGKQRKMVVNMSKFLKDGDVSQNPEIKAGDVIYVAETRKPDISFVLSAISSVGVLINPFIR